METKPINASEAAAALGRIRTPAKSRSSRRNLALARTIRSQDVLPCTCGRDPHAARCPVYQRTYQQARRARLAQIANDPPESNR